jgi:spectinomycin phosphotransferase
MLEPPADLDPATLHTGLRDAYGLAVADLAFLPLGHDGAAWVYRVRTTDGGDYFLKVRRRIVNESGLVVPRALHDLGLNRVVAPLPTATGAPWAGVAGWALILYPFIEGATGMTGGMTERQWVAYGALLRQIHDAPVAPGMARVMGRESFVPAGLDTIERLDAHLGTGATDEPGERALASFWRAHRAEIRHLAARAAELGRDLARTAPPFVICHADIHTNNVLVDTDGRVWFVDWDETLLAPPVRDLMFVIGGIGAGLVSPREEALFFQGYGAATVAPGALAYYRHAWATSDIAAHGEQVCFRPDLGPATRAEGVERFISLFAPGNIVALARAADAPAR